MSEKPKARPRTVGKILNLFPISSWDFKGSTFCKIEIFRILKSHSFSLASSDSSRNVTKNIISHPKINNIPIFYLIAKAHAYSEIRKKCYERNFCNFAQCGTTMCWEKSVTLEVCSRKVYIRSLRYRARQKSCINPDLRKEEKMAWGIKNFLALMISWNSSKAVII